MGNFFYSIANRVLSLLFPKTASCEWCGLTKPKSEMVYQPPYGWFCDYDEYLFKVNIDPGRSESVVRERVG